MLVMHALQAALQLPQGLPLDVHGAAASAPGVTLLTQGSREALLWEHAAALAQLQSLGRAAAMHAALQGAVLAAAAGVREPSALQLSYIRYGNPQVGPLQEVWILGPCWVGR